MADKVLALQGTPAFEVPIVRRSLLRFALSCEGKVPAAKAYVAAQRNKDAQAVADAEELLKVEQAPATPATPSVNAAK
jgi:hypothetical protein